MRAQKSFAWLLDRPIAHRGLHNSKSCPENSLSAFSAAIARGFPIELDVRVCQGGHVVVFHDKDLSRLTGVPGRIEDKTLAEISPLRLLGTGQSVPTLKQVLALVAGQVPLLIEIKNAAGRNNVAPAVCKDVSEYGGPFAIQSFHPLALFWFRVHAPHMIRGQLAGSLRGASLDFPRRFFLRSLLANLVSRPDFIAWDLLALPSWIFSWWRKKLPVILWTVRSEADRVRAMTAGDNFIFDSAKGYDPGAAAPESADPP